MTFFVFMLSECLSPLCFLSEKLVQLTGLKLTKDNLMIPLQCLLHFASIYRTSSGESITNAVYGLPELTRDILEKIKAATGQPINTHRFFPILEASSKDYEIIEHYPFKKTSKYLKSSKNSKLDGGHYHVNKGDKHLGREKDHFYEFGEEGEEGNQLLKHSYGDHSGKKHKYDEEHFYKKNHHKSNGGKKGSKFKKGRKRGKFHVNKGFRDIYHKDEEKKSDFYWNNQHEEGKWIEYGFKNQKREKSHDKGGKGKKGKSKTEESTYEKKENKCTKCKTH